MNILSVYVILIRHAVFKMMNIKHEKKLIPVLETRLFVMQALLKLGYFSRIELIYDKSRL
jgi:hypothetical protein